MTGDAFDCTLFAAAQLSAKLPRWPRSWQRGIIGFAPEIEFAADSLLEEAVLSELVSEAKFPGNWEKYRDFYRRDL